MLVRRSPLALPLLLLALALVQACGKEKDPAPAPAGTAPALSGLTLYPTTALRGADGGTAVASFSVDVADAGADLRTLAVGLRDPSGAVVGTTTLQLADLAGATSGTISATAPLPTGTAGAHTLTFQATDAEGLTSNTLHATFTVVEPPPVPPPPPGPIPAPALTAITPSSAEAGAAPVELTASGSGFELGSSLYWSGIWLPTVYADGGTLHATVPASLVNLGNAQVWVQGPGGDRSNALLFTLTLPTPPTPPTPPVLTAISPASAEAGSGTFSLTATGSGFDAGSTIVFNRSYLTTTLVDAGTLRATVPSYAIATAGTVTVSVYGGGSVSSALDFTISAASPRPVPVLTAVDPAAVDAGTDGLTVTLTGSGFHPASTATWGTPGSTLPTTYVSPTELRATVAAYQLRTPGSFPVGVFTPMPGGGGSAGLPVEVRVPAIAGVRSLGLAARDVVWDPYLQKLYLSIPSGSPTHPNSVAILDPFTGAVEGAHFAGSEPGPLALSDDGTLLYVGHGGASNLTRFALPAWTTDLTIPLDRDGYSASNTATSLAVAPGAPHTVAAAVGPGYTGAIVVYDDAAARSSLGTGSAALCWGGSADSLYAIGSYGSDLSAFPVSAAGLGTPVVYRSALTASGPLPRDPGTGLLYGQDGRAVDPATGALAGTFALGSSYGAVVVPDSSTGRAYFASTSGYFGALQVQAFDLTAYTPKAALELPYHQGPVTRIARWGPDGLVLLAGGRVVLVRGPTVLPAAASDNPVPTVASLAPASVPAGSGNLRITVTGDGFVPGAVVRVNGADRFTRRIGPTQLVAHLPASDLATAGTLQLSVVNPAPGGGTSADQPLAVGP